MRHLSRFLCFTLAALVALNLFGGLALAAEGRAAFGLRPVRFDPARPATQSYFVYERVAPGQVIEDEVLVGNGGTAAGTVRLSPVDGTTANASGVVFPPDGESLRQVGQWIQFAQAEFTLQPGESRVVKFTVTIPVGIAPGQHLGGLAAQETAAEPSAETGALQVKVLSRMVTAVQVNVAGPAIEHVAVSGVTPSGTNGYQQLLLGLRNEGNELVKPHGTLIITDASGTRVQDLALKLDTFLPGTAIQYPVAVQRQALGMGQYHATVDLTYGTSGVTSYEGDFTISATQIAQVFPSAAPALAPPPVVATGAPAASATTNATARAQWPLFVGGAVVLVFALVGGIFLGRRGRAVDAAK